MIIQDDDFLTQEEQEKFKNTLLGRSQWSFNIGTNQERETKESLRTDLETLQFVSPVDEYHPAYDAIKDIFFKFILKHQIPFRKITRTKSNLIPRGLDNKFHSPHVDQNYEHKVFLYYVNDSDGDTTFFEQFWYEGIKIVETELIEQIKVPPKMGRGVVFDGFQYHASSAPIKNNYRCVINIDFI